MKRREFALTLAAGSGSLLTLALAGCNNAPVPGSGTTPPAAAGSAAPAASGAVAGAASGAAGVAPLPVVPASNFVAGQDYTLLKTPAPSDVPKGKAEVVEFFGYWCPHCNHFEPEFEAWAKSAPKEIVTRRVPVAFRPEMAPLQRMYYALEALGKLDTMHAKVFDALHVDKQDLFSDDAVLAWAARQPALGGEQFVQAYKSFGMAASLARANQMAADYGVEGVPSLGVAGKYYVDGEHAKGMARALQIATALGLKEAKGAA